MKTFSIRKTGSATAVMVQAPDFLAVCAGGWLAFHLRFANSTEPVLMDSSEKILVLGLVAFSALFFGKIYRVWPAGSLCAMMGRVTVLGITTIWKAVSNKTSTALRTGPSGWTSRSSS